MLFIFVEPEKELFIVECPSCCFPYIEVNGDMAWKKWSERLSEGNVFYLFIYFNLLLYSEDLDFNLFLELDSPCSHLLLLYESSSPILLNSNFLYIVSREKECNTDLGNI